VIATLVCTTGPSCRHREVRLVCFVIHVAQSIWCLSVWYSIFHSCQHREHDWNNDEEQYSKTHSILCCCCCLSNCPDALIPVLVAILVPSGQFPPSFIARPFPEQGAEIIVPMKDLNLTWQEDTSSHTQVAVGASAGRGGGGGRVFTLQCSLQRKTKASLGAICEETPIDYEYATPFIFKPSHQSCHSSTMK
jgi:hypothetical protein